jgi:glycopeptide antibiotics resistance protein
MLFDSLWPQLILNVILTLPLYALFRWMFPRRTLIPVVTREVELLG